MRERFLDSGGLKRAICEWGPPDAAPILCLHGILDQALAWEPVALDLAARGFRVIAPDLRGHGLSEHAAGGSSYHLLDFLADLDRTVRDIGSEQLTIVGHSMGAVIAAIFSGVRSTLVRNLVLIECPLPSGSNHEDTPDRIATQLDFVSSPSGHAVLADVRAAAQRLRHATPSLPDHFAMRLAQRITEPCEGGVRWCWDPRLQTRAGLASQALDGLDPIAYREVIRRITSSVTLVFAESSGFVKPEQVAVLETELARSRRVVLPGGHNLHLDASAALAGVIADAAASRSAADSI
jgi:pimeloyl-ACP methyl ester carboxylesterase